MTQASSIPRRRRRKLARQAQGDQQQYIDSLESRVSELEERLDFTERLLLGAGKRVGGSAETGLSS